MIHGRSRVTSLGSSSLAAMVDSTFLALGDTPGVRE